MAMPNFMQHFATRGAGGSFLRGSEKAEEQAQTRQRTAAAQKQASASMMNAKTRLKELKQKQRESQQRKAEYQDTLAHRDRQHSLDVEELKAERERDRALDNYRQQDISLRTKTQQIKGEFDKIKTLINLKKAVDLGDYYKSLGEVSKNKKRTGKPTQMRWNTNMNREFETSVGAALGIDTTNKGFLKSGKIEDEELIKLKNSVSHELEAEVQRAKDEGRTAVDIGKIIRDATKRTIDAGRDSGSIVDDGFLWGTNWIVKDKTDVD